MSDRALANEVHELWLAHHPFEASDDGVRGYDHLVPDISVIADEQYRLQLLDIRGRVSALPAPDSVADQVARLTLDEAIQRDLSLLDNAAVDFTIASNQGHGPAAVFSMAATSAPASPASAEDLLQRYVAIPSYLATHTERLRAGQRAGRLPVASLVTDALAELDSYLWGEPAPDVLVEVSVSEDMRARLEQVVTNDIRPALARWHAEVSELATRPDDECGLVHLPDGELLYGRLVSLHTTLTTPVTEIHQIGLDRVAELLADLLTRGASIGLTDLPSIFLGFAMSRGGVDAESAMAGARGAIARAEIASAGVFPEPLPPPCEVAAMAAHLGRTGYPPHYTPPKDSRRGTFWFNSQQPETGSGWAMEALAFHEAVPGHHLQLSRAQTLDVSRLQAESFVTAHGEGWGLYAEILAGELGLYSGTESWLGSLALQLFRAARLVVDTGIHALGWGRTQAVEWFIGTVPLPRPFAEAEIDRYIANPGQALSYEIGVRELLRLRAAAQAELGDAFDLTGFHRAVLDHGAIPLPAVAVSVDGWLYRGQGSARNVRPRSNRVSRSARSSPEISPIRLRR